MQLYQLWEHSKASDGISRAFAQRTDEQIRPEYRPEHIGQEITLSEDEQCIRTVVRIQ